MTLRILIAALLAAPLLVTAPALAQSIGPGEGPADISADRSELFDAQGLVVYSGDVNVVRGGVRLRADRLEAYYVRRDTGGRELRRIVAEGEVFWCAGGIMVEHELVRPHIRAMSGPMDSVFGLPKQLLLQLLEAAVADDADEAQQAGN